MLKLTPTELRNKWINFFVQNDHYFLKPLSFVPENDNSLLFVNSGIAAIKEYFLGKLKLPKNRIVNCQKVIRTNDIEEIGHTYRHHTFFEMLGNFSINDYFKKDAIFMSFDFLTKELCVDPNKLFFTVYKEDKETYELWKSLIKDESHLIICDKDRNFWDMGAGPCGPCTEIYYDRGEEYDNKKEGISLLINDVENERYLEIWNIVFSEFINEKGTFKQSNMKNIDTGAGLERLLTISEKTDNNFENSLFLPIIKNIELFCDTKYFVGLRDKTNILKCKSNTRYQIISDHLRAVVMMIDDEIYFGNKGREYVVRKLFRKAMVCAWILDVKYDFLFSTIEVIISGLSDFYTSLNKNKNIIFEKVKEEYEIFKKILIKSKDFINKLIKDENSENVEKDVFTLVERSGIPFDLIIEVLNEYNKPFSLEKYNNLFEQHKQASKNKNFDNAFLTFSKNLNKKQLEGKFVDDKTNIDEAKIINIYDANFQEIEKTNGSIAYLVLDQTVFFPNVAGQTCDIGTINDQEILEVNKNNLKEILHKVEGGNFRINDFVNITINSKNRLNISQQHTAEHLLYSTLQKHVSTSITRESGKKKCNSFTLKIHSPVDINSQKLLQVCCELSNIINKKIQIKKWFATQQEANRLNLNVDKVLALESQAKNFRVVQIGDESIELCIGTHLNNTYELEQIITTSLTKKGNIYEIHAIAGNENIHEFFNKQKNELTEMCNSVLNKVKSLSLIAKEKYNLDFNIDNNEINDCKNKFDLIFQNFSFDDWLNKKQEFNLFLQELEEWRIKNEKKLSSKIVENLKNNICLKNNENFNCFILKNHDSKALLEFLKSYKFIGNNQAIMILNYLEPKNHFYIIGNEEKKQQVLNYLKNKFNANGGGNKLISGSINISKNEEESFYQEIKELFN